jgi:hypothetical protein
MEVKMSRTSPKVTLREHLGTIDQNSVAGINNFKSLTRRLKKIFINSGYKHSAKVPHLIEQYIHMIFETQDYRCTHWLEVEIGELNGVWNRPGYNYNSWKRKEVMYEIDHVVPFNAGGKDRLDNFQFLSANANQFTKCSLVYEDLLKRVDLSDRLKDRIRAVLAKREQLFESQKWKDFIDTLEQIEGRK